MRSGRGAELMMRFVEYKFGFQGLKYCMVFVFCRGSYDAVMRCLCFWGCVDGCPGRVALSLQVCLSARRTVRYRNCQGHMLVLLVTSQYTRSLIYTMMQVIAEKVSRSLIPQVLCMVGKRRIHVEVYFPKSCLHC